MLWCFDVTQWAEGHQRRIERGIWLAILLTRLTKAAEACERSQGQLGQRGGLLEAQACYTLGSAGSAPTNAKGGIGPHY